MRPTIIRCDRDRRALIVRPAAADLATLLALADDRVVRTRLLRALQRRLAVAERASFSRSHRWLHSYGVDHPEWSRSP
ncbi:MAG: hypothetical protein ABI572_07950 [Actinomycetota bacterium]